MADYKKYAKNLIGNWETGQYEPQRKVTQDIYQTNWNKLSNDFNTLKDKLARNFENAQLEYGNVLNNVQNSSFNRMRNADIDLANRGLTTSGIGDLATQTDIQTKGQDVDKALADLLAVNNASIEGLTQGVTNLGQKQSELAGELAGDLGKLTSEEAASGQQYANLIANIGEGAARRAASRSGGTSKKSKKLQKETDELKRRMLIADTLASTDLSDVAKYRYLTNYLDVPIDKARQVVDVYNTNQLIDTNTEKINALQEKINKSNAFANSLNDFGSQDDLSWVLSRAPYTLNEFYNMSKNRQLNNLQSQLAGKQYQDLYSLLYGNK